MWLAPYSDAVRTGLLAEQLGDLLERPLVATLATYRRSGEVLLSPIWHEWNRDGFNIVIGDHDAKAEHIRRDPRVSVVVYESEPPYRGIEVRGRGHFVDVEEELLAARRRIWARYLGVDPPPPTGEALIRLEGTIRAWDFADDFAQPQG